MSEESGTYDYYSNYHLSNVKKALKSVSGGMISKPYKFTQGAIEFDAYQEPGKASGSNYVFLSPSLADSFEETINMNFGLTNSIRPIQFDSVGTITALADTGAGYFEDGVWYRCRLERHNKDDFTFYIKGGAFGNSFVKVYDFTKTIDVDTKYLSFNDG